MLSLEMGPVTAQGQGDPVSSVPSGPTLPHRADGQCGPGLFSKLQF